MESPALTLMPNAMGARQPHGVIDVSVDGFSVILIDRAGLPSNLLRSDAPKRCLCPHPVWRNLAVPLGTQSVPLLA